jgi:HEAT repeat protein
MLNLIAGCLDHADPTVRETATRLLTRSGSLPAPLADRVAADLHHPDRRAWAAAVLAHGGDARAVAPLAELLTRPECPWPTKWTWDSGPPRRLLDLLEPHADAIWPAVVHRLNTPDSDGWRSIRRDLLRGLATWDEVPAAIVAPLTELLTRPGEDHETVATILARIGPAASAAVPALDRRATHTDPKQAGVLVWARWRITGEQTAVTADTLARLAATPPHGPHSLRLLADLGPAAALHEPTIRNLLNDSYEWTRAEAAHALWRCTADTTNTVPVLIDLLNDKDYPRPFAPVHAAAVTYLGHIGPAAEAATPALTRFLHADRRTGYDAIRHDHISWDQHAQRLTTTALNQIHSADIG